MYAFESRARRGALHLLVCVCFGVAFLLFGISGIEGMAFPALYQISAVGLLVTGTYLLSGYILKLYRYEVSESGVRDADGMPVYDLVITEIAGRRRRVVTRVALRDIEHAEVLHKKDGKKCTRNPEMKVYRYDNNPYAPVNLYLFLPEEDAVTVIPADEDMINILERFCTVRKDGNKP